MVKDKLIQQLMATFLGELDEHVCALNDTLLALEKAPNGDVAAELLKSLFRTVHSLKGAARSVNVTVIEAACHRLEALLTAARDSRLQFDRAIFALLFTASDAIADVGSRLRQRQDLNHSPLADLLGTLDSVANAAISTVPDSGQGAVSAESPATPAAAPEPAAAGGTPDRHHSAATDCPEPIAALSDCRPGTELFHANRLRRDSPTGSTVVGGTFAPPLAAASSLVRVPAEKLDQLLANSGELLVARRRLQSRLLDLASLADHVRRWNADWKTLHAPLLRLTEQTTRHGFDRSIQPPPCNPQYGDLTTTPFSHRQLLMLADTKSRMGQLEKDLERLCTSMADDARLLNHAASRLDDGVDRVRMLPFLEACQGLERTVRDLAQASGREVDFIVEGNDVELDRSVLEGLKDPLLHLVRNAIDHGIEPPDERRAAGKSPRGRITVSAALRAGLVEVVVADDGRAIQIEKLIEQARNRGLTVPDDPQERIQLILLPGFSTTQVITDVSGRGMGLDIVKTRVESMLGAIDISFQPGLGMRFTISLPLTLTKLHAVLVESGGQPFAISSTNVQKLIRVCPEGLRAVAGRPMVSLGGTPVLVASLAETLGLSNREPARPKQALPALVVAAGDLRVAFVVEELIAKQEVVVKGLGTRIRRVNHISGTTLLPSGQIALVLNPSTLVRTGMNRRPAKSLAFSNGADSVVRKRLLVAEDSVTTRCLVMSILEAAGYEVIVAADGEAAWRLLQEKGADLVISDVEMPHMDGFSLCETIRNSRRFQNLPLILVTARETDQDKAHGIEVGANAYLLKSSFDQRNLIETVAQLL